MCRMLVVLCLSLFPATIAAAPGDFCTQTTGSYGDGNAGATYTQQQIDDVLNFVNSASAVQLDACSRIDSTEAANLVSGAPYDAIGTLGADESTGDMPNHIDSVAGVSDGSSDNDLVGLRDCAPVTTSCAPPLAQEPFTFTSHFATNQHGTPSDQCTTPMCIHLVSLIDAATVSVDFAIYGLRGAPAIVTALQTAVVNRGVTVRGVVDTETGSCTADPANFLYSNTHDLVSTLDTSRVKCDTQSHSSIMHNKFFIFDADQVLMGTANVSDTGLVGEYNANSYVVFDSSNLAPIFHQ